MSVRFLRYAHHDVRAKPVCIELEPSQLAQLLRASPGPAVFVLADRDLDSVMADPEVSGMITQRRAQNGAVALRNYFRGASPMVLEGKYTTAGRLLGALEKHLREAAHSGGEQKNLLAVSDEVFHALWARADGRAAAGAELPASDGGRHWRSSAERSESPKEMLLRLFPGSSPAIDKLRRQIERVATHPKFADVPVLLLGPSGAGKERAAMAIHELERGRLGGERVSVNVAAIGAELFETEFFGSVAGVATDVKSRIGLLEQASLSHGTIHLNEIGELCLPHQVKLLRVLQEHTFRRVGGLHENELHARIIADTNRDLVAMVAAGEFRRDLYHRLARLIIRVPSLSELGEDLHELSQRIWRDTVTRSHDAELPREVLELLSRHPWPGGVRELEGVLLSLYFEGELNHRPSAELLLDAWRERGDGPERQLCEPEGRPVSFTPSERRAPARVVGEPLDPWLSAFKAFRPTCDVFARSLRSILESATSHFAPPPIIHAGVLSTAEFAEAALRRGLSSEVEIESLPDLCHARVVVHTERQLDDVADFVARHFQVKPSTGPASPGASARPTPSPRLLTIRLTIDQVADLSRLFQCDVPTEAAGVWATLRIETVLEYAWQKVADDLHADGALPMPTKWVDELAQLSKLLQAVDQAFSRLREGFDTYRTTFPAYLPPDALQREIELLERVLEVDDTPRVGLRLGTLALSIGDWELAIRVLEPLAAAEVQPALRDLGTAICQLHRENPQSEAHAHGQALLRRACAPPHRDPMALSALAGTLKRSGEPDEARRMLRRAHALDAAEPYALWGLLDSEYTFHPDRDHASEFRPAIEAAIRRCQDHVEAGVNLPWALYSLSRLLLLSGETKKGLVAAARAVGHSTAGFMIQTSLESLERLTSFLPRLPGLAEARLIVALGLAAKFPSRAATAQLLSVCARRRKLRPPVTMIGGLSGRRGTARDSLEGLLDDPSVVGSTVALYGQAVSREEATRAWRNSLPTAGSPFQYRDDEVRGRLSKSASPETINLPSTAETGLAGFLQACVDALASEVAASSVRVISQSDPESLDLELARAFGFVRSTELLGGE